MVGLEVSVSFMLDVYLSAGMQVRIFDRKILTGLVDAEVARREKESVT